MIKQWIIGSIVAVCTVGAFAVFVFTWQRGGIRITRVAAQPSIPPAVDVLADGAIPPEAPAPVQLSDHVQNITDQLDAMDMGNIDQELLDVDADVRRL